MSHALAEAITDWEDFTANIVTEDDEPVDNLFSSKQQRLLTRSLYSSWKPQPIAGNSKTPRKFLADSNVGIFLSRYESPLVPDFFLSMDVEPHEDFYSKEHRTYFVWEFGKVPELVLEIVSNKVGREINGRMKPYEQMAVIYHIIFDPTNQLGKNVLTVYELVPGKRLRPRKDSQLPELGLSLKSWDGVFEGKEGSWLRWFDAKGKMLQTGEERAAQAEKRAAKAESELKKLKAAFAKLKVKTPSKRSGA